MTDTDGLEPAHPGKVVFWDGDADQLIREADASELPATMRFVKTQNGLVPVVKVVANMRGDDERVLAEYGPDGQFLRSTRQHAGG